MALDLKYGQLDIPGIGEDEPIIIFRAQDILVEGALDGYEALCEDNNSEPTHLEALRRVRNTFEDWRVKNSDKVKLPDTTSEQLTEMVARQGL